MPLDAATVAAELAARGYRVGPVPTPAPAGGASAAAIDNLAAQQPDVTAAPGAFDRRGRPTAPSANNMSAPSPIERVSRLSPGEVARGLVAAGRLTAGEATEKFGFPVSDPRLEDLRLRAAGGDFQAIDDLTKREGGVTGAPGPVSRTVTHIREELPALVLPAAASFMRSTPAAAFASGGLTSLAELYRAAREDPQATWRALSGKDTPGLQQLGQRLALSFGAGVAGELGGRAVGLGLSAGVRAMMSPQALEAERVLGEAMPQPSRVTRPLERTVSDVVSAGSGGAVPPLREPPFAMTRLFPGLAPAETVLGRTAFSGPIFQNVRERAMEAANRIRLGYLEPGPDVGPLHQLIESQAHTANVQVPTGAINALGQRYRSIIAPGGGDTALADRLANVSTTRPIYTAQGVQLVRTPSLDFDAAKRLRSDLLEQSRVQYKTGLNTAGGELVHAADVVDDAVADGLRTADPSGAMYRQWREANAQTRLNYQRQYMSDLIEKHTTYPEITGEGPQINGGRLADELRRGGAELERAYGPENYRNLVDFADAVAFTQQGTKSGAARDVPRWLQVLTASYMMRDIVVQHTMPELANVATTGAVFLAPVLLSRALTNPGVAKALIAVAQNPQNTARTAAALGKLALAGAAMSYEDDQNARRASTLPPPALAPILNNGGAGIAPRPPMPSAVIPQPGPTPGVRGRGPLPAPFPQPTPSRLAVQPGVSAPANITSPTAP